MDWFLYDKGLRLERVNINFSDKDETILESKVNKRGFKLFHRPLIFFKT